MGGVVLGRMGRVLRRVWGCGWGCGLGRVGRAGVWACVCAGLCWGVWGCGVWGLWREKVSLTPLYYPDTLVNPDTCLGNLLKTINKIQYFPPRKKID